MAPNGNVSLLNQSCANPARSKPLSEQYFLECEQFHPKIVAECQRMNAQIVGSSDGHNVVDFKFPELLHRYHCNQLLHCAEIKGVVWSHIQEVCC